MQVYVTTLNRPAKIVAQTSESAVSPTSKSAGRGVLGCLLSIESPADLLICDTAESEICATQNEPLSRLVIISPVTGKVYALICTISQCSKRQVTAGHRIISHHLNVLVISAPQPLAFARER